MLRDQLKPTLRLAGPVILAELGWMGMGVVDTIMVGPLGPSAIGAAGVGNSLHLGFAIFGMGLLLGLDTLVSQAYGAGNRRLCRAWLGRGVQLALITTVPLLLVLGLVWLLQGVDVLGGSVMSGSPLWATVGPIVLVVGLVLIVIGVVRRRRAR